MPITTPTEVMSRYGDDPEHFLHVAEYLFKPAVEAAGYTFMPPSVAGSQLIQAQIIASLESADLVLCDMSLWNANVFFELGIRVALDKPVAMVRDNMTDKIPFDNAPIQSHMYDPRLQQWHIDAELPKLRQFVLQSGGQTRNELWKYFGISQTAERIDRNNPTDAKLGLLLAELQFVRRDMRRLSEAALNEPPTNTGTREAMLRLTASTISLRSGSDIEFVGQSGTTYSFSSTHTPDIEIIYEIASALDNTTHGDAQIEILVRPTGERLLYDLHGDQLMF